MDNSKNSVEIIYRCVMTVCATGIVLFFIYVLS